MSDLAPKVRQFMTRFNEADPDSIMAAFAPDATYHDPNGVTHVGPLAIRAAFTPLFDGSMGKVHYVVDDVFADDAAGKALVRWTLAMTADDGTVANVRGLDILYFDGDVISAKHCFTKAATLLIE